MDGLDQLLSRRVAQVSLLLLFTVLLALIIGPPLWGQRSVLTGKSVGDRADSNIKADVTFQYYPTSAQVSEQKHQAERNVLPVFDHHLDLGTILLSRVTRAFLTVTQRGDDGTDGTPMTERGKHRGAKQNGNTDRTSENEAKDELSNLTARERFAAALQTEVSPEMFKILQKDGFSADLRTTFVMLIAHAMEQLLINDRRELEAYSGQALMIRPLVGGSEGSRNPEKLTSFNRIKDLKQIVEEIRRHPSLLASKLSLETRDAVVDLVQNLIVPNLVFNEVETHRLRREARDAVQPQPVTFVKGQVLIQDGAEITGDHLEILRAMAKNRSGVNLLQVTVGIALLVLVLLVVTYRFASRQFRKLINRPRDLVVMAMLMAGFLLLMRWSLTLSDKMATTGGLPLYVYLIPIAAGPMLVRLTVGAEASTLFGITLSLLAGLLVERNLGISVDRGLGLTVIYMLMSFVGAAEVAMLSSRTLVIRAGIYAGAIGAGVVFCLQLFVGKFVLTELFYMMVAAIVGGIFSALVTVALLPVLEKLFAYTTDLTLLELSNLNHPLLRELMLKAPGTYHHSMVVGSLSETACEAIGANGLLARVASNFHDVGKMKNAAYFAENFKPGDNPHQRLKPSMSALIIKNHVKDSIDMMHEHGLPRRVIDTASQHHGTTLIEFFYHKALEQKATDEEIQKEDYQYPGPKPQTREAGIIMLADGVEAAARSLHEPTEDRLRALVQRMINGKFTDGQLAQCDLTLRDLHLIAKSFLQVLSGIYHQRPSYPWQREQGSDEGRARGDEGRRAKEGKSGLMKRPRADSVVDYIDRASPGLGTSLKQVVDEIVGRSMSEGFIDKERSRDEKSVELELPAAGAEPHATQPESNQSLRSGSGNPSSAGSSSTTADSQEGVSDIRRLGLN